jgi:FkbM family methyltransferase
MSTFPIREDLPFNPFATDEDILNCFRLILGRFPEPGEWPGHSARAGESLTDVVKTYINSLEFHNRGLLSRTGEDRLQRIDVEGFAMYASPDDLAVGKPLITSRTYEPHVSRIFKQRLKPGMRVLDIGANIGFYSLLASSIVGPEGMVWAIEPNPANVEIVLRSRALNDFSQLQVIQAAAHDKWETLSLFTDQTNGSVSPCATSGPESVRNTVMGIPLRSILEHEPVDILKIDVEGAEGSAVRGMLPIIDRCRPAVFSEFTPAAMPSMSHMTGEEYLRLFTDRGYRLQVLTQSGLTDCGTDIPMLMSEFRHAVLSHIDIFFEPPV